MAGISRTAYHMLFWPRFRHDRAMERFAATVASGSHVIEFGSGKETNGKYTYSAAAFFRHCEFLQTDVVPEFGHVVVDITRPDHYHEFDVALASSVLEHVYDFEAAISGIHQVLRAGGIARIRVPFLFPLHDEPDDYWRFTEHALRRLLAGFSEVAIQPDGLRRAPLGYVAIAIK